MSQVPGSRPDVFSCELKIDVIFELRFCNSFFYSVLLMLFFVVVVVVVVVVFSVTSSFISSSFEVDFMVCVISNPLTL